MSSWDSLVSVLILVFLIRQEKHPSNQVRASDWVTSVIRYTARVGVKVRVLEGWSSERQRQHS